MSKLIKLPGGDWVRASDILKVNKPYAYGGGWKFTIAYRNAPYQDTVTFHVVELNPTFVETEEKAIEHVEKYINQFNSAL